ATIAVRRAELLTGYQIDREMVLEDVNTGLLGDRSQQGPLDFASGHILRVQNPAFGVAALLPEVQLARAIRARDFAFGKVHTQLDQFGDSRRSFLDDGANNGFFAQTRPSLERVAHVQLERILLAGHRRYPSLRVVRVRLGPVLFRDNRDSPARR